MNHKMLINAAPFSSLLPLLFGPILPNLSFMGRLTLWFTSESLTELDDRVQRLKVDPTSATWPCTNQLTSVCLYVAIKDKCSYWTSREVSCSHEAPLSKHLLNSQLTHKPQKQAKQKDI